MKKKSRWQDKTEAEEDDQEKGENEEEEEEEADKNNNVGSECFSQLMFFGFFA